VHDLVFRGIRSLGLNRQARSDGMSLRVGKSEKLAVLVAPVNGVRYNNVGVPETVKAFIFAKASGLNEVMEPYECLQALVIGADDVDNKYVGRLEELVDGVADVHVNGAS